LIEADRLREVVLQATRDMNEAMRMLKKLSDNLDPEEYRGIELALKGMTTRPPELSASSKESLVSVLKGVINSSVTDGFDRGYASAWLEFLSIGGSRQEKGDVKAVGDKPDEDKGADSMSVN
jgi:hypothetical protein